MIAVNRSRRVVGLVALIVVANAAFWGFRYFDDPTVGEAGVQTDLVTIADTAFSPAVIRVAARTEVTWMFADEVEHNVVFDGFSSDVELGGTYRRTFETPGEYAYVCTLHPLSMKGRVIVTG